MNGDNVSPSGDLHRLRRLDTPTVSDALDVLGLSGVIGELRCLTHSTRIVGRASTVQLGPKESAPPSVGHLCTHAVANGSVDDVIVIANDGRLGVAGWGGMLSLAAKRQGIAGVVIDGAVRDVDEAYDLSFPIFARSGTPTSARGRISEIASGVAVRICGILVRPRDLIIADRSGVVCIPAASAKQVLDVAEGIVGKESDMVRMLFAGIPINKVMGKSYETMLEARPDE